MQIIVNGDPTEVPDNANVAALLDRLGLARAGVAVAVNAQVVPRTAHADHALAAGDQVEVLRAVGGG